MSTGESDASGNISQRRYFRGCKCTSLLVPLVFCHERSFEERSFPSEIKNVVKILNDVGGWNHPYSLALSPTSHFLAWPLLEQRWLEFRRGRLGKKNGYRAPRGTVQPFTRTREIINFHRSRLLHGFTSALHRFSYVHLSTYFACEKLSRVFVDSSNFRECMARCESVAKDTFGTRSRGGMHLTHEFHRSRRTRSQQIKTGQTKLGFSNLTWVRNVRNGYSNDR